MADQLVLDLLPVGVDTQPDEEIKDNAADADDIDGDGERVEESKVLNMNSNEYDPD